MAKYTSQYKELGFYVNGELKRFSNGQFETSDKDVVAVLDALVDVKKEAEEKAPAKKAPAKSKSTAKEA